jgi:3-methylcrotonyl-CoA carboxylase beta subunit
MPTINCKFDKSNKEFLENKKYQEKKIQELTKLVSKLSLGGSEGARKKHISRNKLLVNDRINLLIDSSSPFLELSQLAAHKVYKENVPRAGMVTGIGFVHSIPCMIIGNDATVKGGTYFPMTVKKHLRAQEIAEKLELPCIYLVDSGGAYLPMQDDVFPDKEHFGRIFYNQAKMSAKGISQIAVVLGSCTAGGAYVPAMSDETIIVKDNGTIFLAGPPLVKAATGEVVSAEELGGAKTHTQISGAADYFAENEQEALELARLCIKKSKREKVDFKSFANEKPKFEVDDILGMLPVDLKKPIEIKSVISRLVDGSDFFEFKKNFGETIICGTAKIMGFEVGIIANNGVLFSESALKATHFIQLCEKRRTPLLFMHNITGFMVGKKYEHEGIAKHGAKMVNAVASASVPKISLIIGGSHGAGNYGMCGRAYQPDFLFMWPNSKISVMGGAQAAGIFCSIKKAALKKQGKKLSKTEETKLVNKYEKEFEAKSTAYYSSARLWDDGVISPLETREVLTICLSLFKETQVSKSDYGIFRM